MAANRNVGRTASTVGMMEGAFFVSRSDLIQWANSLLQVGLTKVEQCASGAIYCQIIDACHPGTVPMRKVNWMAKCDHEFIPNYKVLQVAFDKNSIEKHINVEQLIRAKYQDNLEFMQWMKCYWEREGAGRRDYDPLLAREGKQVPPWARSLGLGGGIPVTTVVAKENLKPKLGVVSRMEAENTGRRSMARSPSERIVRAKLPPPALTSPTADNSPGVRSLSPAKCASPHRGAAGQHQTLMELNERVAAQQDELDELRSTLDGLERERDYYFRKLREVEILCATQEAQMDPVLTANKLLEDIQGILYAGSEQELQAQEEDAFRGDERLLSPAMRAAES